ncbi:BCD family MFS transporter [Polynucleobacter sp. AP-Melu-500A-A1]|uniref:BCD family MFS transporter n=1 Tax=Polynucleobacter sp. AP-Melu-500A-A1 TaxID=2576929 RepID=UPI001C0C604A|nr:BCD family MFS transporter [Polynucleobacter sp. AP-Melu-500A-A1]MBU3630899.1 BCD family MFS transporter [Polynucleobacter sp. AP-Melu-500A-A1]
MSASNTTYLTWPQIARLGLVQASLGSIVVLTTSLLNRVMVVELALPAILPGALVALHYFIQLIRPRMGFGSDQTRRASPWIRGGILVLASGGVLAAASTVLLSSSLGLGIALATVAFLMIGIGVSSSGTALLVLLAKRVEPKKKAAAATCVWLMMIFGFAFTASVSGKFLTPFSFERLLMVSSTVSVIAVVVTFLAIWGMESPVAKTRMLTPNVDEVELETPSNVTFREAFAEVWKESRVRSFTWFVFVSMLAYSSQDLILEPFAAVAFGFTPAETTTLSGLQNGGVLVGMLVLAFVTSKAKSQTLTSLSNWTIGGCLASALAMLGLVLSGPIANVIFFKVAVFLLGIFNGAFSIAAIGSMMQFASVGSARREGVRMGIWGASQAMAFGLGGIIGTGLSDIARIILGDPASAYAFVFFLEGVLFVVAAYLSYQTRSQKQTNNMSSHLVGV